MPLERNLPRIASILKVIRKGQSDKGTREQLCSDTG